MKSPNPLRILGALTERLKMFTLLPSSPTPADAVVVEVLAALGAEHFDHHAVEMKPLHQHPGERTQEEEVKQHSHYLTG